MRTFRMGAHGIGRYRKEIATVGISIDVPTIFNGGVISPLAQRLMSSGEIELERHSYERRKYRRPKTNRELHVTGA